MASGGERHRRARIKRHDVVAALASSDESGKWSLVVARRGDAGEGGGVRVLFSGLFGASDGGAVRREVFAQRATLLVRVVPTRRSVARTVRIPVAGDADLARTLALIVEAEAPPNVPAHRVGAAFLPSTGDGMQTRCVLLTGWAESTGGAGGGAGGGTGAEVGPDLGVLDGVEERWCTPLGALVALRGGEPEVIIDARESEGAISVFVAVGEKAAARVVVDQPDDEHPWQAIVEETFGQACELAGMAGSDGIADNVEVDAMMGSAWPAGEGLASKLGKRFNAGVTGVLSGMSFRKHAVSMGACAAVLEDRAGLGAFAGLRRDAPKVHEPLGLRVVRWASVPRRAGVLATVAVACLLLVPWGMAWARLNVAQTRAKDLSEVRSKSKDVELRAAMFEQIEKARWPMTKMLGDIAGAAPVGVTLTELRMTVDQNITVEGQADNRELVTQFETNLNATKLFSTVARKGVDPKGDVVEFTYTLTVASGTALHVSVKPSEDFVSQPLAVRLYGEGASNAVPPKGAAAQQPGRRAAASSSASSTVSPTVGGGASSGSKREEGASRRPSASSSSNEPPAEIKDEEIAKLSASEAMKGWAERRKFLSANQKADPSVRDRVTEEATKLQTRMKEAREAEAKKAGGT